VLYFEDDYEGPSIAEIIEQLETGDPGIFVGGGNRAEINIVMVNVQDGEEIVIADRLNEILRGG
jgi:IMP cyclohydrolase